MERDKARNLFENSRSGKKLTIGIVYYVTHRAAFCKAERPERADFRGLPSATPATLMAVTIGRNLLEAIFAPSSAVAGLSSEIADAD